MKFSILFILTSLGVGSIKADEPTPVPPDLKQNSYVNRAETYNLGSTGLRGWIFTKAASNLDSWQGRTTTASRQILVTHVGRKSPADGVVKVNDVILGVAGKPFTDDSRKAIAKAIQDAETEKGNGVLNLMIWRNNKPENVVLKLKIMGSYSATAPYNCPKSTLIYKEACKALEEEELSNSWVGAVNGLALLATGEAKYLPRLRKFAREIGPKSLKSGQQGISTWDWGYRNLFLCEYYLVTGDKQVLDAIEVHTLSLAKGQGMYGTFGHGMSELTKEGELHGPIPPYGPVNAAGIVANISIVMGKLCGIKDPEVDGAIYRASGFFSYYVDKGSVPYGEHIPFPTHENNGKNAMAAMLFAVQGNKPAETQFFAKMMTASYCCREYGHTGQGFSYLWGALGANTGGPAAVASYFKESSWHYDLVRRCDGSFTYDGSEQYGPGKTDDDTYYGKSSYYGLTPNATYVLTYAIPLKKIYLTGREHNQANWLNQKDIEEANYSGRFDLTRKTLTPDLLIEAFGDWSPIVRGWAAEEFASRPRAGSYTRRLITMAEGKDGRKRQGAVEALGIINDAAADKVLARLLTHEDRWLRVKAAEALKRMGGNAKDAIPQMLKAVVDTAEPLYPVVWKDPIQLTHGQLAAALFGGVLSGSIEGISQKLLFPAIRAVAQNPDAMARGNLGGTFSNLLTPKDVEILAPDLLEAVLTPAPADTMFCDGIRMGALVALTKNNYSEGVRAGMEYLKSQSGHGSETRTGEILNLLIPYGTAAQSIIPDLKALNKSFDEQTARKEFPSDVNVIRKNSVTDAIKKLEAATKQPKLKLITTVANPLQKTPKPTAALNAAIPEKPTLKVQEKKYGMGEITILTTPEGANLPASATIKDFPLLIRLTKDQFDFSQVQANGNNIRFTDSAGVQLAYQVEEWDATLGKASIWVRVPSIKGNARQTLRMLWGIKDAPSKSDGSSVFNKSNGYLSVWHMSESIKDEGGITELKDSGTTVKEGMVGKGRYFAGGQGLTAENVIGYPVGSSSHTTEGWFRPKGISGKIVAWGNDKDQEKVVISVKGPPHIDVDTYGSSADVSGVAPITLSEWAHVVHTYENGDSRVYVNGVLENSSVTKENPLNMKSPSSFAMGGWLNDFGFVGDIDEVRVSQVKRSAEWIKLTYENQKPLQTAVGQMVRPGTDFSVIPQELFIDEGKNETVSAESGGALKTYWILKSKDTETIIGTDQSSISFDAGRVGGDQQSTLQFKAVYPQGVKTLEIPISIKETVPDPIFTLKAPTTWDGRSTIEIVPQVSNMGSMRVGGLSDLKVTWDVENIAVTQQQAPDKLLLKRAEKSGTLVVNATLSNGGSAITKSVKIRVTEPQKKPWVGAVSKIDEQPEDGQFYGRDDKNEGTIVYKGSLSAVADSVVLKVYADGRPFCVVDSAVSGSKTYSFAVKIKPGLIKYKTELVSITGGKETVVKTVDNLVCGDAYLINGQSNAMAAAWGEKEFTDTSDWIRSFGSSGKDPNLCRWGSAVRRSKDNQLAIGYWGFDLAKMLMEKHKVPICIINGAVGGTRIDMHQKDLENGENLETIYGRLLWRVRQARLTHAISGVFWHQGENDQEANGPSGDYGWKGYRNNFMEMTASLNEDYPNIQHYYVFQIWPLACSMGHNGSDNQLREVQRNLPRLYSNLSLMSTVGIDPPGGCHFPPEGYAEFARLIMPLVEQFNYGVTPQGSITPPNVRKVAYSSSKHDEVLVTFDQAVKWDDAICKQFLVDNQEGKVISGSAQGNLVKLKVAPRTSFQKLTYINGRTWTREAQVRGENGIAALSFCDVPIGSEQN